MNTELLGLGEIVIWKLKNLRQRTVNCLYDWLSRLTSEARGIDGLGTYTFNYTYNQASQLKSVTKHFGSVTNYAYDAASAVQGVTGSGWNSAANYINSIAYKAFGGVKQINYGNTRQLSLAYNNRLFLTQWNLPNPGGNNNANNALGYNYQYNKYGENNTGRPDYAQNIYDSSLDRAWTYDQVGRLIRAYTGKEARAEWGPAPDGPYARGYDYDQYGNLTNQFGWGGPGRNVADNYNYTPNTKNQNPNHAYDLAGNMTNDGAQTMTYDATGQQATASMNAITMGYDGDGLRLKKVENGTTTYYLRSTVLGQQTVCEINSSGAWQRGYVYLGGQLLAIQDVPQNRVLWTHQEPYSKAQRITDASGAFVSGVEVEPFGLETNRSFDWNGVNQKRKFTTYDRDANGGDEAMFRRYAPKQDRFAQPDPYDGSYSLANPQSLNRYAYTQGDPVNFVDPLGLFASAPGGGGTCYVDGFQVNCGFAFSLLNAGLGFVTNGPGWYFDGSVYVGEVFGWLPGQNGDRGPWGVVGHFAHSFLNNSLADLPDYAESVYKGKLGKKLTRCINKVFSQIIEKAVVGKNGKVSIVRGPASNFLPPQRLKNAPNVVFADLGPRRFGSTNPFDALAGQVRVSSTNIVDTYDPSNGRNVSAFELGQRTFVHELGNLLAFKLAGLLEFGQPITGRTGESRDNDFGAYLEQCVFGDVFP